VGGRGGEGEKESVDGPENDIRAATATTRSVTGLIKRTVFFLSPGQRKNIRIFFKTCDKTRIFKQN
jgi:molybdopterin biosynthesis enzyme MoaB